MIRALDGDMRRRADPRHPVKGDSPRFVPWVNRRSPLRGWAST